MNVNGVQLIRLSADRVVLRRGPVQLLLGGPAVGQMAETLLTLLGEGKAAGEIIGSFPGPLRPEVDRIMAAMTERRLTEAADWADIPGRDALQSSFYASVAPPADTSRRELESATVAVTGINLIARSLTRSLLEVGVGRVLLIGHPVLDNELAPADWADDLARRGKAGAEREHARARLVVMRASAGEAQETDASLAIATSDLGEADALAEASRAALRNGTRFLPAWISDLVGYVGPLTYPHETACFCCYRLRADSNNPAYDVSRAVASEATTTPAGRAASGFLPPMAGVVGEIAAMEAAKAIAGFVPSDAVGRLLQINLLSFAAAARRVLKVPRCPDCSQVMASSSRILVDDRL